jgi:hypothetical protein
MEKHGQKKTYLMGGIGTRHKGVAFARNGIRT